MSEEQKPPDSSTGKTTPSADATKTPLDNLKNMLSQVESAGQEEPKESKTGTSSQGSQEAPLGQTVAKKEILEVLSQIQNISDEMLSPRQVDDLLRPLLSSKGSIDIKNFFEQDMETEAMGSLKTILAELKAKQGGVA